MLPNTPCTISQRNESLLTMEGEDMGLNVIIVPPTGNPGEQEWTVEHQSENTVRIRNVKHGKYIGVGEAVMNSRVVPTSGPFNWTLEEESGQYCYRICVEGQGGEKLYLEFSMLRIYPPQCALLPHNLAGEPWTFRFLD
ncbi:hypothetical protein FS749_005649 [Ceratobasidium sp. UAMH 11750]|nr:hypothetical protein FS749_005649 [Ceratobasidium sp. UAMH 11750]